MNVDDYLSSNSLRKNVGFLTTLDPDVLKSFCKVALENLAGLREFEAKLDSVAGKFGIESQVLERAIESLAYLLSCMRKEKIRANVRKSFLEDLGFTEDACSTIETSYVAYLDKFEETGKSARTEVHFKSLDWRLDVHLESRAGESVPAAKYLMKLDVQDRNDKVKGLLLESSYARLCEVTKELESALAEAKNARTRRIIKLMQ
ncbi:COMM domain-containing protein [Chloropicon primus]|uniref:COMM domain-containing protein n=1 Tax=Chloropicon primus TaxID=1764295 RepID=A0A5B8MCU6_9CHLO|nr:hypothetical protein A3770_01p04320 [Chloropicon primus]UPQ97129.1 COMM domain-containing protein [Chloropicon primus]|eukprot:QDZ17914.1 hypothetical protein A3770_01p04320 [Chloropicon primus]